MFLNEKNNSSIKTDPELTQIVELEDNNIKSYNKCIIQGHMGDPVSWAPDP